MIQRPFYYVGKAVLEFIRELGGILIMLFETARLTFSPPFRLRNLGKQMEFV
jgi:ABC-type transporter Mla maintaining outer membrane lipid asymmetry permease subunit MlaE